MGTCPIVVGIDGGATSTKALALNICSLEVSISRGGPSNPVNVGPERSGEAIREVVEDAVSKLGRGIGDLGLAFAGLAGMDSRLVRAHLEPLIRRYSGLGDRLVVDHDAYVSLLAATRGAPGVLVIAGTGSIVLGYDGKRRLVMGDHGWLLGDEGSGFWVARLALRRLRAALQGLRPHDCLTHRLSEVLGVKDSEELMYWFYNNQGIDRIAGIARNVADIAEECSEAGTLLARGARLLGLIASRMILVTGLSLLYAVGSMFRSRIYRREFSRTVRKRAGVSPEIGSIYPVLGAVYEALRILGHNDPGIVFRDKGLVDAARRLYT